MASPSNRQLERALTDVDLLDELHTLLWLDAYYNRGTFDPGWSCRDHVVVVGKLLVDCGADVMIRHGRSMFVQGSTSDGEPPVGIGQLPEMKPMSRSWHSWLWVEGLGNVDLSPKLSDRAPHWRPITSQGVIGSRWLVQGEAVFIECRTPSDFDREVATASHSVEARTAIYFVEGEEPFTNEIAYRGLAWANSPLSRKLQQRHLPEDIYARAAIHIPKAADGERRPLRRVSQFKAWDILASDAELGGVPGDVPNG